MDKVTLHIDGQKIHAPRGTRLLWAALDAGIEIPNLCARTDREPPFGGCRLCFVEVKGWKRPITSCTVQVADKMVVTTRTPSVDRLVRSGFEMLMSHHKLECRRCPANKNCGLQKIAISRKLKLKPKRVPLLEMQHDLDESHADIRLDSTKCVLCGQCIWVCQQSGAGVLDFAQRGLDTVVGTFGGLPLAATDCDGCLDCVHACPTGALSARSK